jgi:hypothetical protein
MDAATFTRGAWNDEMKILRPNAPTTAWGLREDPREEPHRQKVKTPGKDFVSKFLTPRGVGKCLYFIIHNM